MADKDVVLITGASRGIGLFLANHLSKHGYRVIGTSRAGTLPQQAAFDCMLRLDVRSDESVQCCVQEALHRAGRIDALINNAGYPLDGPSEAATIEQVKEQFEVNFYGVVRMFKAVFPTMRRQSGGKIINISSGVVSIGFPFMPYYTASKCALEGLSSVLRQEVKPFGIHVSVVEPGFVKTDIASATVIGEDPLDMYEPHLTAWMEAYRRAIQSGADPSEVARCVQKILTTAKPGFLYSAGSDVRGGKLLKHLLPEDLFYRMIKKVYRVGE